MESQAEILRYLIDALEELSIPYAVVGSVASMAYGEPRYTQDIDALAELSLSDVVRLKASFPPPQFYMDPPAAREAIRSGGMFNIIHPASGFKIDLYPATTRDQRGQIARALSLPAVADRMGSFGSPEDVITKKLDYYRMGESPKHLRDIAGMLQVSGDRIDREQIRAGAEARGTLHIWEAIVERVDNA